MAQPTRYWRFSYDSDESLAEMLDNGSLIIPTTGARSVKYDPEACVATRMKLGDGVFLGRLDPDLGVGRIVAIGIVLNAKPVNSVSWRQIHRNVHPNPQGGLAAWRERCFLFSSGSSDRYNLAGEFLHHFPDA